MLCFFQKKLKPTFSICESKYFKPMFLRDGKIFCTLIFFWTRLCLIQVKSGQLPLLYVARKIVSQSIQVWKKGIPLLYSNVHYLVSVYESFSQSWWYLFISSCVHFKTDLEPFCARVSTLANGVMPPLSQLHCVFSLWKLTRNYSWNTKVATLSWSAVQIPMLSVWFGKESTMLSLQTIKKWSDARLRKALPGWSLDYTRASSHPKLSSCSQFL